MIVLRLLPAALALLVLAAHFLRGGQIVFVAACLGVLATLFLRRPWVPALAMGALVIGALEWLRTIAALVAQRAASGEPAGRMVAILGTVVAVTLLGALAFRSRAVRAHYAGTPDGAAKPEGAPPGAA